MKRFIKQVVSSKEANYYQQNIEKNLLKLFDCITENKHQEKFLMYVTLKLRWNNRTFQIKPQTRFNKK